MKESGLKDILFDYQVYRELKDWLISRESDIAYEMEDFGGLKKVFEYIFKREPKEQH